MSIITKKTISSTKGTKATLVQIDECPSTQLIARSYEYASDNSLFIFHTWKQMAGIGRTGPWQSCPGTLTATWAFPAGLFSLSTVTMRASLAVSELLNKYSVSNSIKWPNDVQVEGAKCAGILCEELASGRILVGIGINTSEAPPGAAPVPALRKSLIQSTNVIDLIKQITDELVAAAELPTEYVVELYNRACITVGKRFIHPRHSRILITGVSENGLLIADRGNGKRIILSDVRSMQDLVSD